MTTYPNVVVAPLARTTTAGTAYEQVIVDPGAAGDRAMLLVPLSAIEGSRVVMVLSNHGKGATETYLNDSVLVTTRDAFLDRGWVVAVPRAHSDAWANDAALADSVRTAAYCAALWDVRHVLLHGGSMGGLTTLLLYGRDLIPRARACAAVDPAANLTSLGQTSSAHAASIRAAYGGVTADGIPDAVRTHDPCRLPLISYAGKRMRLWASPTDTSIAKSESTDVFAERFTAVAAELSVVTVSGQHFTADHFRPAEVLDLYDRALPQTTRRPTTVWNGSTWHPAPVRGWNGARWVDLPLVTAGVL